MLINISDLKYILSALTGNFNLDLCLDLNFGYLEILLKNPLNALSKSSQAITKECLATSPNQQNSPVFFNDVSSLIILNLLMYLFPAS